MLLGPVTCTAGFGTSIRTIGQALITVFVVAVVIRQLYDRRLVQRLFPLLGGPAHLGSRGGGRLRVWPVLPRVAIHSYMCCLLLLLCGACCGGTFALGG